jgi:hypothetical protein
VRRRIFSLSAPLADAPILRTGVHEALWTPTPSVPLSACPVAAVRLMTQDQGELVQRANRAKTLWNDGVWSFMCLKTHWTTESLGPSSSYKTEVVEALGITDSGGTQRGEIWEVGNEPNDFPGVDRMLRALAGSYQTIRDSGRKVLIGHILGGGGGFSRAMDRLDDASLKTNPATSPTGGADWSMIDGWAWHGYNNLPSSILNQVTNLRNALNNRGHSNITIWITENGYPHDRLNHDGSGTGNYLPSANPGTNWTDYTATQQRDKLNAQWDVWAANNFANAKMLKLRLWTWFAYADYNPGKANGYNHCGLAEQDTRAAQMPNYQDGGGAQDWALHVAPYDGRAKSSHAAMALLPKETVLS